MIVFRFTKTSEKELYSLDPKIRTHITESLTHMKDPQLLGLHSKRVVNLLPATHRLRIGNYRLLYSRKDDTVLILTIGHRKEVYK